MECPECHTALHPRARYCGCGWKYNANTSQPVVTIDCSHQGCNQPAMCKIQTRTGWANFCAFHYDRHFRDEANASLDKYGLAREPDETPAEHVLRMREFVKNGFKSIGKKEKSEPQQSEYDKKAAVARLMDEWATDLGSQP